MKATKTLHDQGQSLWLDNITRDILRNGTLARYIRELSVTGLTSNPTIFDHAVKASTAYDAAIQQKVKDGKSGEELFFELALEDVTSAADLFRSIWDQTHGVDGWVSLEVSPLLAHDTASTLAAAKDLHAGSAYTTPAADRNACGGPAQARNIPTRPPSSISASLPRRSRSIPCPRPRYRRSPNMERSRRCCPPTAATVRKCWRGSLTRVLTSLPLPLGSRPTGRSHSSRPGTNS